jgi:hypothetical protein
LAVFFRLFWTDLCPPPNSYIEPPIPNVTVVGDRALKKIIKIR